jgi:GH43 family beta-xylosidase
MKIYRIAGIFAAAFCLLFLLAIASGEKTAHAGSYTNPIADMFDPHIVTYNGEYYMVGTSYDTGIYMQKSSTIAGLRTAPKTLVYSFSSTGAQYAESPYIKFLLGKWYIYIGGVYSPTGKYSDMALEGSATDPLGPYTLKAVMRTLPDFFKQVGPSVLEMPNGNLYFCTTTFGLYIQPMTNPWTLTGSMVTVRNGDNDKTYPWEGGTWEISSAFVHTVGTQTTVTIPYSSENGAIAKSDGPDGWNWSIGAMVNTDGNILNPASWSKLPTPLMHGGPDSGFYRVLAANPFKSPDGTEDWFIYNGGDNMTDAFSYRRGFVQKFTWNANGTPNFGTPLNLLSSAATPSGETGSPSALTPGTMLLSDNFLSGSGNWTVVNGNWSVVSGRYQASNMTENFAVAGETRWADYFVQASIIPTTAPNNSDFALLGRVQNNTNFYQLCVYTNAGVKEWRINKVVNGVYTTLASGPFTWTANTQYWLRFDLTEPTLTALISTDGVNFQMLGSVNDDTFTYGKVGLRMWGGLVGSYDDILINQNRPSWGGFYGGPWTKGYAIAVGTAAKIGEYDLGRDAKGYYLLSVGGKHDSTTNAIDTSGVVDPAPVGVYQTQRWSDTRFYYDFPSFEPNKEYLVRLHFAEFHYASAGQRSFHVELNGNRVLTNYDPLADAGGANKAVVKEYVVKSDSLGHIQVAFLHGTIADGNPIVNGIEVRPVNLIFSDNFNDGDLIGWSSVSGTWSNPGNLGQGIAAASTNGFMMRSETGTNFTYEADIKLNTVNSAAALVFRSNSTASSSYVVNLDLSGPHIKLFKFPYQQLAVNSRTLTTGVWYHLKVVVSGTSIKVYFDHKAAPVISITDSSFASGQFGINSWNGTVQFDNVYAYTRP